LLAARSVSHATKAWTVPVDLASLLVESTLLTGLLFQILRRSSGSTVFRLGYGTIFRLRYRAVCGGFADLVNDVGCGGSNLSCVSLYAGLDLSLEGVTFRCNCIEGGKSLGLNLCLRWRVYDICDDISSSDGATLAAQDALTGLLLGEDIARVVVVD
jgi:hypothetical protein